MIQNKTIIAIDPGQFGGIASWSNGIIAARAMPATEGDVIALLRELCPDPSNTTAYVELVGGFVKGRPQPGSAMFSFGRGFGFLLGSLMAMRVRIELTRPQEWQSSFSLGTASSCETQAIWKRKLKAEAQRLYPQIEVTLKTADALLILDYAIRQQNQPVAALAA